MNPEWKKYTGSDEQIAEIRNPNNLLIFEYIGGMGADSAIYNYRGCDRALIDNRLFTGAVKAYLICQPHPHMEMACQQFRTGQPVWIKTPYEKENRRYECLGHWRGYSYYVTNTPNWNIPNAEYRFTPFEEE